MLFFPSSSSVILITWLAGGTAACLGVPMPPVPLPVHVQGLTPTPVRVAVPVLPALAGAPAVERLLLHSVLVHHFVRNHFVNMKRYPGKVLSVTAEPPPAISQCTAAISRSAFDICDLQGRL